MIRQYQPADLNQLLTVWEEASRTAHSFLPPAFFEQERKNIPERYLPMATTWVYEEASVVVGFLSLIGNEVGALFVGPSHQGRGIGRLLMDHARGLREDLEVEVFKLNSSAKAFYKAYGFAPAGESQHPETGHTLLRLRLGSVC